MSAGSHSKPFAHLVDSPRAYQGGVLFSIDGHALERTIFVTADALQVLDPDAQTDRARVHRVMTQIRMLTARALEKAARVPLPQLLVLEREDIGPFDTSVERRSQA
jgi:hypothetical protein